MWPASLEVQGLGFGVTEGLGFGGGLGLRVWGSGRKVQGTGSKREEGMRVKNWTLRPNDPLPPKNGINDPRPTGKVSKGPKTRT